MSRIDRNALKLSVLLLLCAFVAKSDANDAAIRDLCLWRMGNFSHPEPTLCNKFVQCQIFNGNVITCAADEIFIENEGCVPGNFATCERSVTFPSFPTLTPPTTSTPPPSTVDLNDYCRILGVTAIFLNPNNCHSLVICREGIFWGKIFCPEQIPVVDPDSLQCVQGNPKTCEIGQLTPPTNPPPSFPTLPSLTPPSNPGNEPPLTEFPTVPTAPSTPPELSTLPPIMPPVTTTSAAPPPSDICRGNNLRFVADPSVCYRFFYCLFGIPVPGECDEDRIFDAFFAGCVRGNQATCTRDRIINVTVVTPTRSSQD